jgi:hypothetical protein
MLLAHPVSVRLTPDYPFVYLVSFVVPIALSRIPAANLWPAMVKAARSPKKFNTVLARRLRSSSIPAHELDAKAILREPPSFKRAIAYQ